jgi:flavin reductase (DIM6/NTAB) family NADH-FMN oxidoreductase RutF
VKKGHNYGMCCAWAQMIDYDKISLLLGAQSVTGKILETGDIVGVSALAKDQAAIAYNIGSGHSDKEDKFSNINYFVEDTAILISNAKVTMKCRVRDIFHFEGLEQDNFIILEVIDYQQNENKDFLSAYKV